MAFKRQVYGFIEACGGYSLIEELKQRGSDTNRVSLSSFIQDHYILDHEGCIDAPTFYLEFKDSLYFLVPGDE